jgi:hypothetical protein
MTNNREIIRVSKTRQFLKVMACATCSKVKIKFALEKTMKAMSAVQV